MLTPTMVLKGIPEATSENHMVRLIVTAIGFVLLAMAAGLVIMAGYEVSLIFTGNYNRGEQAVIWIFIGVMLMTAGTVGLGGRVLMHRGRGTAHPLSR